MNHRTLKILGSLLSYPSREQIAALPESLSLLRAEGWIPAPMIDKIAGLAAELQAGDVLDVQEDYVSLFDRTPSLSLHLFEHVHGDSKERGQAMVDLMEIYQERGLVIQNNELPDYLPLFLEYLSFLDPQEARQDLTEVVNVIAAVRSRLEQRESPYAAVFEALDSIADRRADSVHVEKALEKASGAPQGLAEMDAEWDEQAAFSPSAPGECPMAREMIGRMYQDDQVKETGT